jgi:hypothetical protein
VTLSNGQRLILADLGIELDIGSDSNDADTSKLIDSDNGNA